MIYLKTDTQGYDIRVLTGAGEKLRSVLALQSELSVLNIYEGMTTDFCVAIAALKAMGFEVSALFPVTREQDLRAIELDCVMVRASDPVALP